MTPWDVKVDSVDVTLDGLSVMIGMPTHRDIPPQTVASLWATKDRCDKLSIPCDLGMVVAGLIDGRNGVLDDFLKSKANRLFWIDSDQSWRPAQFIRLLALSKLVPIVGATYTAKMDRPTFYVRYDPNVGLVAGERGLAEIHGMGLGFAVLQREPLERLAASKERVHDEISGTEMADVFRWGKVNGNRQGEDMAFFSDLRALGYKVYLDPLTDIGHIGTKEYKGTIRDAMTNLRGHNEID